MTWVQFCSDRAKLGSWFELEPRLDDGEDGEDGGDQAAGPDKPRPGRVDAQPVEGDEEVAAVLQQVQQQRRVAVQNRQNLMEAPVEPGKRRRRSSGRGGRGEGVGAVGGRQGGLGASGAGLRVQEEAELVQVPGQAEDQSEQVVPADRKQTHNAPDPGSRLKSVY